MIKKYGKVYWFTGLSGAGKTTCGKLYYQYLSAKDEHAVFLDGDILREVFGNVFGYTQEERLKCATCYSRICNMLAKQGITVVICTISMFHEVQEWNRQNISGYYEIYIEVPMDILNKRNQKGLYTYNNDGLVAGKDFIVEFPKNPDIVLKNDGSRSPEEIVDELIGKLEPQSKGRLL